MTASSQIREYTIPEIQAEIQHLRQAYNVVRLVDAEECRTLEPDASGSLRYGTECHKVWNSNERCTNCSILHSGHSGFHYTPPDVSFSHHLDEKG